MIYEIVGDNLPVLKINLEKGESIITEAGSMSWMSSNIKMDTSSRGGVGKSLGRLFSGESLFQNKFTSVGSEGEIALATALPGSILDVDIDPYNSLIAQKSAFLACTEEWIYQYIFKKDWLLVSLVAKVLLCRNFLEMGKLF